MAKVPPPIMGFYDRPMWESIRARQMKLQRCPECRTFQYPPSPCCWSCLNTELEWVPISGKGRIVSWIIGHHQYLAAYPPPYNIIVVQLEEGPLMLSNLEGRQPEQSWIGTVVELVYSEVGGDTVLPRFRVSSQ